MLALLGLVTVPAASFPEEFRNATHIASVFADLPRDARARNTHVEATLNHPCPAQVATCTVGSYCAGGENVPCPAGTYGIEPGLSDAACSGECDAGYFCAAGSTSPTAALCGQYVDPPQAAYCPAGAGHPMPAPVGFATTPLWGSIYARTGVVECFADGDGLYTAVPKPTTGLGGPHQT